MRTLKCFENFKCVGGICPDNCCIGWEIGIDGETLKKYKEPPLFDFVKDRVDFSRSVIKLSDDGRCPFLNRDNLCDIIINFGYENISYICKKHPSFINEYDGITEYGYGLCCDEALRLLCEGEVITESREDSFLFDLRGKLFEIIYDDSLPFNKKISAFLDMVCKGEDILFFGEADQEDEEEIQVKKASVLPLLEIMEKTEPINEEWTSRLKKIKESYKEIEKELNICEEEKYKKLFYYYTFRYFLKDIQENSLLGNGKLIVILVLLNIIFDSFSKICGDGFNNTRLISKQMEYSMENIEFLIDRSLTDDALGYEELVGIL